MKAEESKQLTARLEKAAIYLLKLDVFRKPDDLARRFGLPVPVVRYWWRQVEDQVKTPVLPGSMTPKQAKQIRKARQTLEGWEKIKRYRPECGATLPNGRQCRHSVAIRPPEGWNLGALSDRCRMHGGLSRRVLRSRTMTEE